MLDRCHIGVDGLVGSFGQQVDDVVQIGGGNADGEEEVIDFLSEVCAREGLDFGDVGCDVIIALDADVRVLADVAEVGEQVV